MTCFWAKTSSGSYFLMTTPKEDTQYQLFMFDSVGVHSDVLVESISTPVGLPIPDYFEFMHYVKVMVKLLT